MLMEADVEGLIGAGRHERTGDRLADPMLSHSHFAIIVTGRSESAISPPDKAFRRDLPGLRLAHRIRNKEDAHDRLIITRRPSMETGQLHVGAGARSTCTAGNCRGRPTAVTQSKLL
jgi:hypothetical protein